MSTQQKMKNDGNMLHKPEPLLTRDELITMIGLIVAATGFAFFLAQAEVIDWSSPWWTLYLGVPGLVFLGAGGLTYRHHQQFTSMAIAQFAMGALLTLLAFSFVVDPTWSFTRDWTLFKGSFWNGLWRWLLLILGAGVVAFAVNRRSISTGIFGAIIAVVGLVFILDISWDLVWPLFVVGAGLAILSMLFRPGESR